MPKFILGHVRGRSRVDGKWIRIKINRITWNWVSNKIDSSFDEEEKEMPIPTLHCGCDGCINKESIGFHWKVENGTASLSRGWFAVLLVVANGWRVAWRISNTVMQTEWKRRKLWVGGWHKKNIIESINLNSVYKRYCCHLEDHVVRCLLCLPASPTVGTLSLLFFCYFPHRPWRQTAVDVNIIKWSLVLSFIHVCKRDTTLSLYPCGLL